MRGAGAGHRNERAVGAAAALYRAAPSQVVAAAPATVTLKARLSEIGTLELWAVAAEKDPDGGVPLKWRLQFDLDKAKAARRKSSQGPTNSQFSSDGEEVSALPAEQAGLVAAAAEQIRAVFAGASAAAGLPKRFVQVLGPRDGWSTATLRALWEELKTAREKKDAQRPRMRHAG